MLSAYSKHNWQAFIIHMWLWLDFIYLFNGISTSHWIFNVEIHHNFIRFQVFRFNTNNLYNQRISSNYFYFILIICLHTIIWYRLEKKLDGNYTRMLRAILNKSWRQHPTRHQLYSHLPPITKTIQVRWTRHAGHCWRSRDELISDVLLWTPTHGRAKAGRPARTYIQQLCKDMGCCPEDLPEVMNDREKWRERVRDIRATSTWWWFLSEKIIYC